MNSNRRYGTWAAEADRASGVLRRSQDGLCCETNSLSRRSGEGQGEGGGLPDRFQATFSRLSPLPGPLPARSSRGEGEEAALSAPRAFVAHRADARVIRQLAAISLVLFLDLVLSGCDRHTDSAGRASRPSVEAAQPAFSS